MKKIAILSALLLFGCAHPTAITVENGNEQSLTCQQLGEELAMAARAKTAAHDDDNFRFSNILIVPGIASVYNIEHADSNATKRIELLNNISLEKHCSQR